jgi:hypothetical protein
MAAGLHSPSRHETELVLSTPSGSPWTVAHGRQPMCGSLVRQLLYGSPCTAALVWQPMYGSSCAATHGLTFALAFARLGQPPCHLRLAGKAMKAMTATFSHLLPFRLSRKGQAGRPRGGLRSVAIGVRDGYRQLWTAAVEVDCRRDEAVTRELWVTAATQRCFSGKVRQNRIFGVILPNWMTPNRKK